MYEGYWNRNINRQLAADIWGDEAWLGTILQLIPPKQLLQVPPKVVPFRVYGDGADVFGSLAATI